MCCQIARRQTQRRHHTRTLTKRLQPQAPVQSATYSALLADGAAGAGVHMAAAGDQGAEAMPPVRRQRVAVPAARAPHTLGQVGLPNTLQPAPQLHVQLQMSGIQESVSRAVWAGATCRHSCKFVIFTGRHLLIQLPPSPPFLQMCSTALSRFHLPSMGASRVPDTGLCLPPKVHDTAQRILNALAAAPPETHRALLGVVVPTLEALWQRISAMAPAIAADAAPPGGA